MDRDVCSCDMGVYRMGCGESYFEYKDRASRLETIEGFHLSVFFIPFLVV